MACDSIEDWLKAGFESAFPGNDFSGVRALPATDAKFGAGKPAGLAIGLTLILIHHVCINLTGTSVNPARSIGPALFAGGDALKDLWVFIFAPLVGGALSALCWKGLAPKEK